MTYISNALRQKQLVSLVHGFRRLFEGTPVSEVLSALLGECGYERMLRTEGSQERLDNLAELKQSVYEFENNMRRGGYARPLSAHVALLSNADIADASQDNVRLMTIHAAKGLEFNHVFVCSLSEGVLPSRKRVRWRPWRRSVALRSSR